METAVGISIFTCAGMLTSILFKPSVNVKKHSVSIYWMVVLAGACALLATGCISIGEVLSGLSADTAVNPIKILVLFFSMSMLSVFLDEVGFFRYLACLTLTKAKASQKKLFVFLFVIVPDRIRKMKHIPSPVSKSFGFRDFPLPTVAFAVVRVRGSAGIAEARRQFFILVSILAPQPVFHMTVQI